MNKAQIKMLATVTAGVMVAGYLLHTFRDVTFVAQVRDGFGA